MRAPEMGKCRICGERDFFAVDDLCSSCALKPKEIKGAIIFDFDGVIHSYSSGWQGATNIPDPPVPGIKEAIQKIRRDYEVFVLSTRCYQPGGIQAIEKYLQKHQILVDGVIAEKVPALLSVDDRAICFDGKPEALLEKIKNFIPWNKKPTRPQ